MGSSESIAIDSSLVRRLIAAQFPQWTDLPVRPVRHGGWDNRTFHLGDDLSVRLPSAASYALQVEKEQRWLPRLAPHLPLPIPEPVAMGRPDEGYPWSWSVYRWRHGEIATHAPIGDLPAFAATLGEFLAALQRIDADGGPSPGQHNFFRGGALTVYDHEARWALEALAGKIDTDTARSVWEAALVASWTAKPVWFHGDVSSGNLLVEGGRLAAVIDFGTSGVGDPACDLSIAWTMFSGESRAAFRAALPLDRGTWARGRGWTLWKAMIVAAEMPGTDRLEVEKSRRVIGEVLADHLRYG
ncbi:aminoglycoside phosphotransferase family protein [Sinorhizobium americanum]|uniref:Aminoglycoside phosphotransferase n=1 Tax=Sinorhizobium americanum TaxID=194963 RepID=A0A1L3LNI3_9HYPH|nr:aminoglycoside phosphotransferase family protein [Sinorhizobium americanum]APG84993.1 aminoglycoside phosphotransferase [Sinorhizobium americanum CCGM7]APG91639.1 aminoglycoside phosphotransferase [Sinorhizobium americanum]OAP47635.1 aminoglycoside phosphotransferase [Sinorhizobium americanum]